MNIGELSKQSHVPSKTIRNYEDIDLLPKSDRESNGYRKYPQSDVQRLKLVAGAGRLDISNEKIRASPFG